MQSRGSPKDDPCMCTFYPLPQTLNPKLYWKPMWAASERRVALLGSLLNIHVWGEHISSACPKSFCPIPPPPHKVNIPSMGVFNVRGRGLMLEGLVESASFFSPRSYGSLFEDAILWFSGGFLGRGVLQEKNEVPPKPYTCQPEILDSLLTSTRSIQVLGVLRIGHHLCRRASWEFPRWKLAQG